MALITCPECGKQVSDRAKKCPQCGCPMTIIQSINNTVTITSSDKNESVRGEQPENYHKNGGILSLLLLILSPVVIYMAIYDVYILDYNSHYQAEKYITINIIILVVYGFIATIKYILNLKN